MYQKWINFIENKLVPPLVWLSNRVYIQTIQKTFAMITPYILLGSMAMLVLNLGDIFSASGGLHSPILQQEIENGLSVLSPILTQILNVTVNMMTLLCTLLNSYFLGEYYHSKDEKVIPIATCLAGLISLFCFMDFKDGYMETSNFMATNIFSGILMSIISVELYRFFLNHKFNFHLPKSVPPMVGDAFMNIIPTSVVVFIFATISKGVQAFDVFSILQEGTMFLVSKAGHGIVLFVAFLLDRVFWFVGLHGSSIVEAVMSPIWSVMNLTNLNDYATGQAITYPLSSLWVNSYVRLSVFPIAVLLMQSKAKRLKSIGKLSVVGSLFNIAEPILYGLPIVMNPLMFVPWVFGFGVLFIWNAFLMGLGVLPPIVANVLWTTPAPLMAYIGSGYQISAFVFSCINMGLVYLIFLPFVKMMEKEELKKEEGKNYES